MHGRNFDLHPVKSRSLPRKLARAITAAYDDGETLVLDPGVYRLDEPIVVTLDHHHVRAWGVWSAGATIEATFPDSAVIVTLEAVKQAQARFMTLSGLCFYGADAAQCSQPGLELRSIGTGQAIYNFTLDRLSAEKCDDAFRLYGNVFEGDIRQCSGRDGNCVLALGNDETGAGGILSSINVWGGSFSQNKLDAIRTFGPQYQEPYDFSVYGTYIGNNGRYAINAKAGVHLLKGVRMENAWCDPATHDPDDTIERAAVKFMNFARLEQCDAGGNGNCTSLADGYLSGRVIFRDCKVSGAAARQLARLDGKAGNAFASLYHCDPDGFSASANVMVDVTP